MKVEILYFPQQFKTHVLGATVLPEVRGATHTRRIFLSRRSLCVLFKQIGPTCISNVTLKLKNNSHNFKPTQTSPATWHFHFPCPLSSLRGRATSCLEERPGGAGQRLPSSRGRHCRGVAGQGALAVFSRSALLIWSSSLAKGRTPSSPSTQHKASLD